MPMNIPFRSVVSNSLALDFSIFELGALFFVSKQSVNLIRLFLCGDALQWLGSLRASLTFFVF